MLDMPVSEFLDQGIMTDLLAHRLPRRLLAYAST
jgi:hypothetical protein